MPAAMLVVAGAVVRRGRVLAAHRTGGWEFPGGKVEPGETEAAAIVRELREELTVDVIARESVATVRDSRIEMRLWRVDLVAGEPRCGDDHDELRWVAPADLDALAWLPLDVGLLGAVRSLLWREPPAGG